MSLLPEVLQPYFVQAKNYLKEGLVGDIEFSVGTYQVQVIDAKTKQEVWAFLQLDQRGNLKDCFCSCGESEEPYCVHLAAALLKIYNDQPIPLHVRFQRSLWNQLCQIYANRLGDNPTVLQAAGPGRFIRNSVGGKEIFSIKAKTPAAKTHLKEILEYRYKETEETSIKFSNLPADELALWREGRPSPLLRYELSFWNDIAHWLMMLQESNASYEITFNYGSNELPNQINIIFPELEVSFYLAEANLPKLIPTLETVKSPLGVHHAAQNAIKSVKYDKNKAELLIDLKAHEGAKKSKKGKNDINGVVVDGWLYVPGEGFYEQDQHQLLATPHLTGNQVSEALNEHFTFLQQHLEDAILHVDPIVLSYTLQFDAEWNLHITAYVFNPGDLTKPGSHFFGDWVYLDDDGFYPIEDAHFDSIEKIIPSDEVGEFVRQERTWLNAHEGFHTHLASIEAQLNYNLSADNRLTFSRLLSVKDNILGTKDFGSWIYIEGQGFYAKVNMQTSLPLRPDIAINSDQIPLFIRMNRAELQLVPGFFGDKCPIEKAQLHIELDEEDVVRITPEYKLFSGYENKDVRFFEDFVYVEGEGFHELPMDRRLPERYRQSFQVEPQNLPFFIEYELDDLREYASQIDTRLQKPSFMHLSAVGMSKGEQKGDYLAKLNYQTDLGFIPVSTLWWAIKQKKTYLFTEAGCVDISDKRFDWIRSISKKRIDRRNNTLHLSTLELIRLNALEGIEAQDSEAENIIKELTEFRIPEKPDLSGLKSNLRPYQELGVHWLWFLHQHNLSGLLCDDMGLGKTHQAMALIAAIINFRKKLNKSESKPFHFLIVCPTSVIFHWQEKLESFLPDLRICTFHGTSRSMEEFHHQYDVLLTSYGIWRIENELLSQVPFELAIFDEVQIAKNQNSRVHASLLTTDAQMRLGLTGTPIENHLRELKSLFDVVLPTYMPSDTDYRELFVKPIEKENSKERRALLRRFINPFVLRRKKGEVLPDLPVKTEEIAHCMLSPEQQMYYQSTLHQSRQFLLQQLQDEGTPIPYMHIFALLSNLKQICNHPAVFLKKPADYKKYESGKWDLFVELLSEARESQQKVVVFSQYLHMLDIFEEYLNEKNIGFSSIRGATIDRGEQIQRFNHDPRCEVFLGSLQAAGLGVDLTAGSVVIHYDRWWNAAREDQATDRVHRIGQTRGVQVFKMVTKGTFEERIDAIITRKSRLLEDVVSVDDHRFMKQFNRNEIIQLLQDIEGSKEK
jgi:superfamily II DNA or RNA helicase